MGFDRRNTKLADVVDYMRAVIESGEYPPGSKLPSQPALMEKFDASRTTVESATRRLRRAGVIYSVAGLGKFVQHRRLPDALSAADAEVAISAELVDRMHDAALSRFCPVIVYSPTGSGFAPALRTDEDGRDAREFLLITEEDLERALVSRDLTRSESLPLLVLQSIAHQFSAIATIRVKQALRERAERSREIGKEG